MFSLCSFSEHCAMIGWMFERAEGHAVSSFPRALVEPQGV